MSTNRGLAVALLSCCLVLTGCHGQSQARAVAAPASCAPMPEVAAHRGGTEKSLENTLGSFGSAGEAGIKTWELDVHFDVKGTPVVLHDDTVDRVSPMTGPIAELDASNNGIPTDDGQYIPTLREVYDLAEKYHAHVLTEIKVMPTATQWKSVTADIDETIGRPSVTLMSFEKPIVLQEEERFPGTETGLLHGAGYLAPEQVKEYGTSYMQSQGSISASRAEAWHAAGIKLYAWTVDKQADWAKLSAWPVDVFITNNPIAYEKWAGQQCRPVRSPK
jgi:glycerophosphoryl diester phosphodiesterase